MRILASDPGTIVFILLMPLLMMAFLKPVYRLALIAQGYLDANGAEQAVPGMAVTFASFFSGFVGFAFMREHGWGTWERLRASHAGPLEIMAGKVVPALAMAALQMLVLFAAGGWLFGLRVRGSLLGVAAVAVALSVCLIAFGMAITAFSKTAQQLNAYGSLGGILFATLGGAFAPLDVMPGWARAIAPAMPTYWAMRGFNQVVLEAGGLAAVALPVLVLAAFTAGLVALTYWRFSFEETKIYFG